MPISTAHSHGVLLTRVSLMQMRAAQPALESQRRGTRLPAALAGAALMPTFATAGKEGIQ